MPQQASSNSHAVVLSTEQQTILQAIADALAGALPLPTGAATEATLAAVLAKIIAAPSTEAKQDTIITALASLLTELALKADLSETQPVSAASLPLPTGAATQTTLAALLTELQLKADLTETQPVSAASLPLPTGAGTEATLASILAKIIAAPATEAKQDTGNTSLGSIDGKTPALVSGATPVIPVTPTTAFTSSAATTNATSTKASAGTVWNINATNINAAARYLKLYNKASAPTVGTDVPVLTLPIASGLTASGAIPPLNLGANGLQFSIGIAWALTTGAADSDTGAVAADEIKVAISYT